MKIVKSELLTEINFIDHGFYGKTGGYSSGNFESLNVGINRGDDDKNVLKNREMHILNEINNNELDTQNEIVKNKNDTVKEKSNTVKDVLDLILEDKTITAKKISELLGFSWFPLNPDRGRLQLIV